jgi:hypothetical protein
VTQNSDGGTETPEEEDTHNISVPTNALQRDVREDDGFDAVSDGFDIVGDGFDVVDDGYGVVVPGDVSHDGNVSTSRFVSQSMLVSRTLNTITLSTPSKPSSSNAVVASPRSSLAKEAYNEAKAKELKGRNSPYL